jgi:hypothetical protein
MTTEPGKRWVSGRHHGTIEAAYSPFGLGHDMRSMLSRRMSASAWETVDNV